MEDVGTISLSDDEVRGAADLPLKKGGFPVGRRLLGNGGVERLGGRVQPRAAAVEYPIVDLPLDHPIFRAQFIVSGSSRRFSRSRRGGAFNAVDTSERGCTTARSPMPAPSRTPRATVMVLMTHNTDISDAWEREGEVTVGGTSTSSHTARLCRRHQRDAVQR